MSDTREAVRWATYPGDVRHILSEGPFGPTTMGEAVWPVTADYDATANKTRVGFSYLAPTAVSA